MKDFAFALLWTLTAQRLFLALVRLPLDAGTVGDRNLKVKVIFFLHVVDRK